LRSACSPDEEQTTKRSLFSEEQIIGILKDRQTGVGAKELCRKHGISDATFNKWRSRYGGMEGEPCPPLLRGQWRATPGG
jgi:Transposase.